MVAAYVLIVRLLDPTHAVAGWASRRCLPLVMIGGLQIVSVGVWDEQFRQDLHGGQAPPRFIVEERHGQGTCSQTSLGEAAEVDEFLACPLQSLSSTALVVVNFGLSRWRSITSNCDPPLQSAI